MNFPFFIAKRYLISKKSNNAINIISGVSVLGICVGTMALIVVLSVFNGLVGLVESMYDSVSPDISITIKEGKVFNADAEEIRKLKKNTSVIDFTEVIEGKALLKYNDLQCVATIKGVSENYNSMTTIDTLIREGSFNIESNNIVISKGVQYTLNRGVETGYVPISIYAPKRGEVSTYDAEGGLNELKANVSGVFTLNEEFDKYVIMDINKARKLFDYTNELTKIELNIKEGVDLEFVQHQVSKILGEEYVVKNREQQNELLYKTIKSEKLWIFIILLFILIVATFNVISSLTMLIIEKKNDIMILRHIGADNSIIQKIFLFEGLMITLLGAFLGIALGVFLCWLQIHHPIITLDEGYLIDAYPVKMEWNDFLLVTASVLFIGFVAAWYPVRIFTKRYLTF